MKVTALAGGVGGAKLANGLAKILSPEDLGIIVNTGDDFSYLDFYICPDMDTVIYNLAGINNPITGYGIKDDTFNVIAGLERLGHEIWFRIGDYDIAMQIERKRLLNESVSLSEIIAVMATKLGVHHKVFPMCDTPVQTLIITDQDQILTFQEYFVKFHFQPIVKKIVFDGALKSRLPKHAQNHLEKSDLVIICPSNPYVSIDPILSVPGIREILEQKPVFAVSPLISGKTIKGPAAKIMHELGIEVNSVNIARHYGGLINGIVIDTKDLNETALINHCGIISYATDILMPDVPAQVRLAQQVLDLCKNYI
ncbi:MAG TPA: 2-phospho-L-lactate transferase [Anaerolineaceae bacterium]|nr:2-phospho-L-lactate transferase [Anaerolineaceae bacterium]